MSALAVWHAAPAAQQDVSGTADFSVFLKGQRVGSERVTLARDTDGWIISSTGTQGAPFNLTFDTFVVRYANDWSPRSIELSAQLRGTPLSLKSTFTGTEVVSDVVQAGQQSSLTHTVSPNTVALPNSFYSAYEALALRLHTMAAGETLPVYIAPQAELQARIERITPRRMEMPGSRLELRQFDVVFPNPAGPLNVEIWVDPRGRLARIAIPAASIAVVREDLTSVMARLDTFSHPRDRELFVPANGFNLAATITPPVTANADVRPPVVVLLSGSGAQDRDETVFGIPILGQVAGRLSDAGFFVVRYDKRGVGQSGGRLETSTINAYAEDAAAVVQWLRKRRDIDRDRIVLVGHSEGGAVALLVAGRMRNEVAGVALLAAPGLTGRAVTLQQQQHQLERSNESETSKQEKVALQMKLMDAVVSGRGWETIPPELRRQADTPWFKSWLSFDPADAMRRTRQPILILNGSLDVQVPPSHADRLEILANGRSRRPVAPARKIIFPGVNHLLVPATTGLVDEYGSLPDKNVSAPLTDALITWLREVTTR